MSFPRYERYKPSEVEWLGDVPEHWQIKPIWAVTSCNDDVLEDSTASDFEIEYVEISGVDAERGISESKHLPFGQAPSRARRLVQDGDVIISTVRTYLRAIAAISNPPANMVVSTGFAVLRPRAIHSRFLGYLFRTEFLIASIISRSVGVSYPAINAGDMIRFALPLPPPEEQVLIAAFLDYETAKIDTLVDEQKRLIELLKEKRQAVISHAVTKGLTPNVPMKDSGVEWMGKVPEHWELKRLKYVSPQVTVGIVVEPSKYYAEIGVPALRSLNVRPGKISQNGLVYISDEANELLSKSKLRTGDLVAVRSGQPGTTAVVPPDLDGCNCIDLIIVRKPNLCSEWYLCWYLGSDAARRQFSEGSGGAIQQHFNIGTAANLKVPVPPVLEQQEIVSYLDRATARIDLLIREAETGIALLRERRSTLISAAVTGKIDVRRTAAANLCKAPPRREDGKALDTRSHDEVSAFV